MTDIEKGRYDPPVRPGPEGELPTAYGGRTELEPTAPGRSLGQVPDPDDADVDEAGDAGHRDADTQRATSPTRPDIDTNGTTAQPE